MARALVAFKTRNGRVLNNTILCDYCTHSDAKLEAVEKTAASSPEWDFKPMSDISEHQDVQCVFCGATVK